MYNFLVGISMREFVFARNSTKIFLPHGTLVEILEEFFFLQRWDLGEDSFFAKMHALHFLTGKLATSAGLRQDPGVCPDSWRDPTRIPVPILQGPT